MYSQSASWPSLARPKNGPTRCLTTRSHDFGTIARGAKAEFAFEFTNPYLGDVHIANVRTSCGCATVQVEKDTVKTYEKGAIIAHINSNQFLGNHGGTITLTIDKPVYAQVQLQVKVYVFNDVMLEPSSVALGNIARGNPAKERSACGTPAGVIGKSWR